MTVLGTAAYELEPIEYEDEQDLFLSILYHDSRGGNAIRMLLGEDDGKHPYVRHFANKDWNKIEYRSTKYNAYATVNTFRSYKRRAEEVFNFSGIFIDLDGHEYKTVQKMDAAIERTKKRLRKAFEEGEITAPTMITHTGRGLGLFYILNSSIANSVKSQKSIRYLNQVRAALTAKYKKLLSEGEYLEVDTTVKDNARVCRIPLTLNKKINRWCRLIHVSYSDEGDVEYCDLKQLAEENHLFDEVDRIRKRISAKKVVSLDAYRLPFLTIRLQKLEILQEIRNYDCEGSREYMVFIYYNAAKLIYGAEDAVIATREYNEKFSDPLSDEELDHAFDVTDKNVPPTGDYEGFYKIPDAWIMDTLQVTEEENAKCCFGASKRQIERQNAKAENARRREERNKTIAAYIKEHPETTYPDIASHFSVSESMIYRICKEYDIHRNTQRKTDKESLAGNCGVAETLQKENLQNLTHSLLGVSSAQDTEVILVSFDTKPEGHDSLIQAYMDLYGQITERRQRKRQKRRVDAPGQYAFRWRDDGEIEYYLIS